MAKTQVVKAATNTSPILGTFEGECADSNITNLNGLDITREVWEEVFNSDDYKHALEQGWLIGYLGHPEDPECMDFQNACIVMTDGYIDDAGKVQGKFNLIDTPVGRIVKTFQDAGVQFGISVRGLGDITNNSVDPGSFVFRGFDLVAFPAFPESIPEFVAASSDIAKQTKYKAICAAVKSNVSDITSSATLDVLKSQFAEQSDEFKMLENRQCELDECDVTPDSVLQEKLDAMTELYLREKAKVLELTQQVDYDSTLLASIRKENDKMIKSLRRITSSQIADLEADLDDAELEISEVTSSYKKMKKKNRTLQSSIKSLTSKNKRITSQSIQLKDELKDVHASTKELDAERDQLLDEVDSAEQNNLKYRRKLVSTEQALNSKIEEVEQLHSELAKTVSENEELQAKVSNLDSEVKSLRSENSNIQSCISEYQDAYAGLYASSIGVELPKDGIYVSATTRVSGLCAEIQRSQNIYTETEEYEDTIPDVVDADAGTDDGSVITM